MKRGDLDLRVYATGELTASHIAMVVAPPMGGDSLQITELAHTGESVKKGDLVADFDPSEQRYKWEQSHSELLQAQQEITKAKADAAVLAAQDKVALLKAKYGVRSAELDVQKNELLSKIDADKNDLALRCGDNTAAKRSMSALADGRHLNFAPRRFSVSQLARPERIRLSRKGSVSHLVLARCILVVVCCR